MSNTSLTNLANALTEQVARRAELRQQDRATPRHEDAAEPFGAMVSEWAQRAPAGATRQESKPRPPQEQKPDSDQPANPSPRAEDVAPRARASEARSRTNEAPRSRRDESRRPDDVADEPTSDKVAKKEPAGPDSPNSEAPVAGSQAEDPVVSKVAEGDTPSEPTAEPAVEEAAAQAAAAVVTEDMITNAAKPPEHASAKDANVPVTELVGGDAELPQTPAAQGAGAQGVPGAAATPGTDGPVAGQTGEIEGVNAEGGLAARQAAALTAAEKTAEGQAKSAEAKAEKAPGKPDPVANPPMANGLEAKEGSEPKAKPEDGKTVDGKAFGQEQSTRAQVHHPIKTTPFAELFHGMGTQNAIYKPGDVLAGLDRALPTAALSGQDARAIRPTPMQMLPIEIGMQAVRGVTSFQIRLDPAELGRVDVTLDISENGEVNASLVVDRVETLQMLRRDASTLQQAFEQAGLKQSTDGLSFSLRGEGQNGHQNERGQHGQARQGAEELAVPQMGELVMRRALISNSSLDLMI